MQAKTTNRADRLKAALRENLKRRKAQARARRVEDEATGGGAEAAPVPRGDDGDAP